MGIKHQELIDGCFARAAPDEHIFVLRGTDPSTPEVIRFWAGLYRERKLTDGVVGHELAKAIKKHTDALEVAKTIERIQFELKHLQLHGHPSWSKRVN